MQTPAPVARVKWIVMEPAPGTSPHRSVWTYNPAIAIYWLGESFADDAAVGGKVAGLSGLVHEHPVPPGFAVLGASSSSGGFEIEVAAAYRRLGKLTNQPEPAVAVRSSAAGEDSVGASFAGVHDTFLNVLGIESVVHAVRCCIASASSSRARAYRLSRGLESAPDAVTVLVQQFVVADASGVAFSADPVTGSLECVIVNSAFGIGESIVSGTVSPDTYRLRRPGLEFAQRTIADKAVMTVGSKSGVREVAVPTQLRNAPALQDEQVRRVAQLAVELEEKTGRPVDIEFAFKDGCLALLQCRPITTL